MANATATENSLLNQSFDDFNGGEFSNTGDAILMSLLEDSEVEEYGDDERLRFVIQSLEAEIINQDFYQSEDILFSNMRFDWIDMEMDYVSPDDEMGDYFLSHCLLDKIETMSQLRGIIDYSHVCYGMPMEEENYSEFWQQP